MSQGRLSDAARTGVALLTVLVFGYVAAVMYGQGHTWIAAGIGALALLRLGLLIRDLLRKRAVEREIQEAMRREEEEFMAEVRAKREAERGGPEA